MDGNYSVFMRGLATFMILNNWKIDKGMKIYKYIFYHQIEGTKYIEDENFHKIVYQNRKKLKLRQYLFNYISLNLSNCGSKKKCT